MGEIRIKRDISDAIVYGIHIDPNIQDPSNAVTYLEDAVGMIPASMGSTSFNAGSWADAFFMPKPCMVRYDGTVDYYLDPLDYSKKADGTASDIADPNYGGNAMMEWGLIWYKFDTENLEEGEVNFYVSNKQVDNSYHCWCNYDADGNIIPHFYTAIYNGTGTDKLRSISGVQLTPTNGSGNTTGQQEISRAMANNTTTKTEWYIDVLADRELINMLLVLIGKSLNVQAVFGRGLDSGDQATKEAYVTGTLDNKGLFWGVTDNGNNAVKVFGIENYWGCVWHRVAGMVSVHDATTNSNTVKIKLTHSTVDGTTVDGFNSTGNGYIDTGVEVATNVGVYIRKMKYFDKGYSPLLTTGGSATKYYSDYTYVNYVSTYCLLAGGCPGNGLGAGPFCFNLSDGFSGSHWYIAACLSLKPRAKVPYNPDWDNLPAHQFVNGQFVDIPTHHYTNGRWQGELTSQSPLKFRADGEMLDWRVEGRTSGNLFDINGDIARESSGSIEISENQIIITVSATWGRDYVVFDKIFNPGLYTIKIISSSNTSGAPYSIGFLSTTPLPGWTYNEYYAAYVKDFDKNNTLIIRTTESMRIGFRCISSQTGQKVTLSNIKILEGAYTPETIPEDEPYGVGNWDETAKKYRIPIWVEGKNLFDGEWKQGTILSPSSAIRVSNKNAISLKTNTVYTIGVRGSSIIQYALVYRDRDGKVTYDSGWFSMAYPVFSSTAEGTTAEILIRRSDAGSITPVSEEILNLKVIFIEGTYTSSTIPLYEVNIFTDHQLMDGDSIDFSTTETTIPLATGNNTLTVDTAVKPKSVFVKFEG